MPVGEGEVGEVLRIEGLRRLGKVADRSYIGQIGFCTVTVVAGPGKNLTDCLDTDKEAG